jgi:hypothetical protein
MSVHAIRSFDVPNNHASGALNPVLHACTDMHIDGRTGDVISRASDAIVGRRGSRLLGS